MRRKAVGYVRVSDEKQVSNYSLDTQENAIRRYAQKHGIELLEVFREEGKSGRNTNRPAYKRMMKRLSEEKIDVLLIHKLDRIHRNIENSCFDFGKLRKMNVALITCNDGREITNQDQGNMLLTTIQTVIDANFSINLSKETRKGLLSAAEQGRFLGGVPPYGFCVDRKTGTLAIDQATAPAVRMIFSLYADGFAVSDICDHLEREGYQTQRGKKFKPNGINSILHNEKYCGIYTWDKATPKDNEGHRNSHAVKENYIRIEGGCPAIVSKEVFEKAQKRLLLNRKKSSGNRPKRYYPLNSMIYCSCGSRMSGNVQYSGKHRYFQYRCAAKCGAKSVLAEPLEEEILGSLTECLLNEKNKPLVLQELNTFSQKAKNKKDTQYQQLCSQKSGLERKQENLLDCLENGRNSDLIQKRLEKNHNDLKNVTKQIDALDRAVHDFTEDDYQQLQARFEQYLQNEGTLAVKDLLRNTIDKIIVLEDSVEVSLKHSLSVDKQVKDKLTEIPHNKKKENNSMNYMNITKADVTLDAVILGIGDGTTKDSVRVDLIYRMPHEVNFKDDLKLEASEEILFSIMKDMQCDVYELPGNKIQLRAKISDNKIQSILGILA